MKVFIIGASSGIGYATVQKFVTNGDTVINMSRTPCDIANVENIICDVSNNKHLIEEINKLIARIDKLDIFIYSAGFSMTAPLECVQPSDYRYLFEVNLFGFMTSLQLLIPLLRKSHGTACVVGSVGGALPIPYDCFYSSSKAAVNMLVSTLKYELMPKGVRVISVMPGGTKTAFSYKRKVYKDEDVGDYAKDKRSANQNLQNLEQNGAKASTVATTIYNACTKSNTANIATSGIMNKLTVFASKIMPQNFVYYINTKIYFK